MKARRPLTHGSLFSGIGGFDLSAEIAGWTNLFNCEINPFCQAVLKYHFPNEISYSSILETDFSEWRGRVDVLSGVFHASPFRKPEKGGVPMTTATSGRLCLEQYARSVPDGSWAKTFSELLIGMTGWSSSRCALTWKLKATKSNRSYFQLAASTPRTKDTGHGLLLTPSVTCIARRSGEAMERRRMYRQSIGRKSVPPGNLAEQITIMMKGYSKTDMNVLLPTPTQTNANQGINSRNRYCVPLLPMAAALLPTVTADSINMRRGAYKQGGTPLSVAIQNQFPAREQNSGETFQLNPLFVEEMMGFPNGWILTPFLRERRDQDGQAY